VLLVDHKGIVRRTGPCGSGLKRRTEELLEQASQVGI
jgi:hypothetical protein